MKAPVHAVLLAVVNESQILTFKILNAKVRCLGTKYSVHLLIVKNIFNWFSTINRLGIITYSILIENAFFFKELCCLENAEVFSQVRFDGLSSIILGLTEVEVLFTESLPDIKRCLPGVEIYDTLSFDCIERKINAIGSYFIPIFSMKAALFCLVETV